MAHNHKRRQGDDGLHNGFGGFLDAGRLEDSLHQGAPARDHEELYKSQGYWILEGVHNLFGSVARQRGANVPHEAAQQEFGVV